MLHDDQSIYFVSIFFMLNKVFSWKGDGGVLLAYQIAFDLYENASQQFINKIEQSLIDTPIDASTILQPMEIATEEKTFVSWEIFFYKIK